MRHRPALRSSRHPHREAWIESLFGHLKAEWPHLCSITDPVVLRAELAQVRAHYNGTRLHAGIGYVTPDDEHEGRGAAIRKAREAGLEAARLRRLTYHRRSVEPNRTRAPAMLADSVGISIANSETPHAPSFNEPNRGANFLPSSPMRSRLCPRHRGADDAGDQLRLIVQFHCELFHRGLDVIELAQALERRSVCRAVRPVRPSTMQSGVLTVGRELIRTPCAPPDVYLRTAVDLLWVHCGPDLYAAFVLRCGWEPQRIEARLVEGLRSSLLASPAGNA